jgi:hypothetical protein
MIPPESREEARYLQDLPSRWDFCCNRLRALLEKRSKGGDSLEIRNSMALFRPERDTCPGIRTVFPGEPWYAMSEIGRMNRSGGDQLNPCSLSLANYVVLEGAGHDFSILFEASVIVELYSRENE